MCIRDRMYAVGRIPGGYLKREAKPSDHGTLVARMVDRPIRPGFPDGYKNEVHIVATPFVIDGENLPDTICVAGASAALLVGGAPFDGPAACVRIGRDIETGEFIVNPTNSEQENSDLELTIAGTCLLYTSHRRGREEDPQGRAPCPVDQRRRTRRRHGMRERALVGDLRRYG